MASLLQTTTLLMKKFIKLVRQVIKKVKEILSNKYVQIILISGSIAVLAFFGGKYLERRNLHTLINVPSRPTVPIFKFISSEPIAEPKIVKTSFSSFLEPLQNLTKHFGSLKAASPVPSPPVYDIDELANPNAERISQIVKYGLPGLDNVLSYTDYVISYDNRNRIAHWVLEHLTEKSVQKNNAVERSKCNFMEADSVHPYFRARNLDYKGSGYDRGHLAAAGNHKSCQKHIEETFYLTNIAPQVGKGFNRDSWNRLEKYVRKLTKVYPNVYCCTGPLFLPKKELDGKLYVKYEVIGPNQVAVPTHFFKVVVGERNDGKFDLECYVMQNAPTDDAIALQNFQVPPDTVERLAGLIFFDRVTQDRIFKLNGKKQ